MPASARNSVRTIGNRYTQSQWRTGFQRGIPPPPSAKCSWLGRFLWQDFIEQRPLPSLFSENDRYGIERNSPNIATISKAGIKITLQIFHDVRAARNVWIHNAVPLAAAVHIEGGRVAAPAENIQLVPADRGF